jgi:hypothetical protein
MKSKLLAAAAAGAMALGMAGSASALTYTSKLEYTSSAGPVSPAYGLVTIDEVDANNVKVTVDLGDMLDLFVDTGAHWMFTFNLVDDPNSTVTVLTPLGGSGPITYQGEGSFTQPGFGTFTNAFACCGKGSSNGKVDPFVFNVQNSNGITFGGVGATFDGDNRLIGAGTGNRFTSNAGGWWFTADVFGPELKTFAIGAKDAFGPGGVPEPTTWVLMILGFGGAGAMLRRRRVALA